MGEYYNYTLVLFIIVFITLSLEVLQSVRMIIMVYGFKLNKGAGACVRLVMGFLPVSCFIMFFVEAIEVLGFDGDVCFCNFETIYKERFFDLQGYDCMKKIRNTYQIAVYVKLVYYSFMMIHLIWFYYINFSSVGNTGDD